MSQQKEELSDNHGIAGYSHESSIMINTNYSKAERLAVVKSYTDRLKLTVDDIRNSMNRGRLNSLSIIPPDLLPFDVSLVDGKKVTILETDPVVTFYDGELTNLQGNILHVYLRNEGEELDEDFIPPKRMCTVTAQTLDEVLPSIINDLVIPVTQESQVSIKPGTSKKPSASCNAHSKGYLLNKNINQKDNENCKDESISVKCQIKNISAQLAETNNPNQKTNDQTDKIVAGFKPESPRSEVDNIVSGENLVTKLKKDNISGHETVNQNDNGQRTDNATSPFSSKFQVIGLLDMGTARDSGSEEGLHNAVDDFDNKEWHMAKETASIIVDKEVGKPPKFKSVALKTSHTEKNKIMHVRKSARAHKPKIRSHFKSWDDLKIRLPAHRRKGRISKGTQIENQNKNSKKLIIRKKSSRK